MARDYGSALDSAVKFEAALNQAVDDINSGIPTAAARELIEQGRLETTYPNSAPMIDVASFAGVLFVPLARLVFIVVSAPNGFGAWP